MELATNRAVVLERIEDLAAFFELIVQVGREGATRVSGEGDDLTGLNEAGGTTRKLQVVTPWSANIGGIGFLGIFPIQLGFGGIAMLDLNIIPMPAPEPGFLISLGAGAIALVGMARARRR